MNSGNSGLDEVNDNKEVCTFNRNGKLLDVFEATENSFTGNIAVFSDGKIALNDHLIVMSKSTHQGEYLLEILDVLKCKIHRVWSWTKKINCSL